MKKFSDAVFHEVKNDLAPLTNFKPKYKRVIGGLKHMLLLGYDIHHVVLVEQNAYFPVRSIADFLKHLLYTSSL